MVLSVVDVLFAFDIIYKTTDEFVYSLPWNVVARMLLWLLGYSSLWNVVARMLLWLLGYSLPWNVVARMLLWLLGYSLLWNVVARMLEMKRMVLGHG